MKGFLFLVFKEKIGYNLGEDRGVIRMNKRGFSLVELMGVIVILMVIVLLATSGYRLVSRKVKETTYDNKVSNIEIKAVEYANNTGKKNMNVDQLVKEGLITADDSDGNVINPVDGSKMNCHLVYITEDSGNLYGNYTDQEECDADKLVVESLYLKIEAYKANEANEITNEKIMEEWVNSNVVLVVEFIDTNINPANVEKLIWKSNVGKEEREVNGDFANKNKYLVTAEQIVNSIYNVEITMKDGTVYQVEREVKIDKQRPIIYESEIQIEKENEWAVEKEVTIKATDGNGSGVYGYFIGTSNDCIRASYEEHQDNVYRKKMTENGIYYVCVRDNAGNISEDISTKKIEIKYIDNSTPTISVKNDPLSLGKDDYDFKENVVVTWGPSGVGTISCNPTMSLKTGMYPVTCTAIGNNGLKIQVTFNVRHNYPARYVTYQSSTRCVKEGYICPCGRETCNAPMCKCMQSDGSCPCGWEDTNPGSTCCKCSEVKGCVKTEEYCSRGGNLLHGTCSYYDCPSGGTLNETTCYY